MDGISLVESKSVSRQKYLYKGVAYETNLVGHKIAILAVEEDILAPTKEEAVQIASIKMAGKLKTTMDADKTFIVIAHNIRAD
jgi:hypothetical protein